jgi:tetratricopeptide (TPR) repeat protein
MRLEVSPVKMSYLRERLLPILVLRLCLYLILLIWIPSAKAQVSSFESSEGEISGTILLEANKRPASQVAVSLKSRAAGIVRSVLTDLEGHFRVRNLPRGTYEIAVEESGYEAARTSTQLDGPSAQLVMYLKSRSTTTGPSNYSVSVRELKIPNKARDEMWKGLERISRNDTAGSLTHFLKATQIFPNYFEAYYNLGLADMALGHSDDAKKAFQTSIDLSGGQYALAEFAYGFVLCHEGKPVDAERIIRRGLEAKNDAPEGYAILGQALRQLNRLEEAEKVEQEALLRNPHLAGAYLVLSDVAEIRGDYRTEILDLDAYLKLQPSGPGSELARKARAGAEQMLAKSQPQN